MTYPEHEQDLETPEVDAAEQATPADPSWVDETEMTPVAEPPIGVPEWDALEQERVVQLEDEYR